MRSQFGRYSRAGLLVEWVIFRISGCRPDGTIRYVIGLLAIPWVILNAHLIKNYVTKFRLNRRCEIPNPAFRQPSERYWVYRRWIQDHHSGAGNVSIPNYCVIICNLQYLNRAGLYRGLSPSREYFALEYYLSHFMTRSYSEVRVTSYKMYLLCTLPCRLAFLRLQSRSLLSNGHAVRLSSSILHILKRTRRVPTAEYRRVIIQHVLPLHVSDTKTWALELLYMINSASMENKCVPMFGDTILICDWSWRRLIVVPQMPS